MPDNTKKVLDAMKKAGKPVRPGDIAKMTGLDSKEVSKIISELERKVKFILQSVVFMHQKSKKEGVCQV